MNQKTHRIGFTLVEILASLLIFGIGMLGIVATIMYGMGNASRLQSDASAWTTAMTVLKDPKPMGGAFNPTTGLYSPWQWSSTGNQRIATDNGSAVWVWKYTVPAANSAGDHIVPDMVSPIANNASVFNVAGAPLPGCARGWLNGYYVERREQTRAADRIADKMRMVEVRVDVYWAAYGNGEGTPMATVIDRIVRQETP